MGVTGLSSLRPDLIDPGTGALFEIKPDNTFQWGAGLLQLQGYKAILNAVGGGVFWRDGTINDYYYAPITIFQV